MIKVPKTNGNQTSRTQLQQMVNYTRWWSETFRVVPTFVNFNLHKFQSTSSGLTAGAVPATDHNWPLQFALKIHWISIGEVHWEEHPTV